MSNKRSLDLPFGILGLKTPQFKQKFTEVKLSKNVQGAFWRKKKDNVLKAFLDSYPVVLVGSHAEASSCVY